MCDVEAEHLLPLITKSYILAMPLLPSCVCVRMCECVWMRRDGGKGGGRGKDCMMCDKRQTMQLVSTSSTAQEPGQV